ncbi:MAG: hypothetical protein ACT4P5_22305 [Armatimonadota bacterium]
MRRSSRILTIISVLFLIIPLIAVPARADHEDRDKIEIRGHVASIDRNARSFYLQTQARRGDRGLFLVLVDRRTEFEVDKQRHRDDDEDGDRGRHGRGIRLLAIGDAVEVEGRLVAHRTILAREIELLGRGRHEPFPIVVIPVPVIFFPYNGSVITGHEFLLSGRTVSRARVTIQIGTGFGPVSVRALNFETVADHNGLFSAMIRSGIVQRGLQYQITVQSHLEGAQSPSATLIVYQQ